MNRRPLFLPRRNLQTKVCEWMLDSGAYSAWRQGKTISPVAYMEFAHQHLNRFEYVVCLDTIPGGFGSIPTAAEARLAADKSFENFLYMKDGIDIKRLIPVYHQGEPLTVLYRLLDAGATYIGISPLNGLRFPERMKWVKEVIGTMPPGIRTHGFGITTRNPHECVLTSMDSSAWSQTSGCGLILTPSTTRWVWTSVTNHYDLDGMSRINDLVLRTRKKIPDLPDVLTGELLSKSYFARALWNIVVQRGAIRPHTVYTAICVPLLVPIVRHYASRWILASYHLLNDAPGLYSSLLTAPDLTDAEILTRLQPKKDYRATSTPRRKQTHPILPGLA